MIVRIKATSFFPLPVTGTNISKNAAVTVLVLQFFYKWNDLIFSMTFINDTKLL